MKIVLTLFVLFFSSLVVAEDLRIEAKKYLQSKNLKQGMNSLPNEEYFFVKIYHGSVDQSTCKIYHDIAKVLGKGIIESERTNKEHKLTSQNIQIVNGVTVEAFTSLEKKEKSKSTDKYLYSSYETNIKLTKDGSSLECKRLSKTKNNIVNRTSSFASSYNISDIRSDIRIFRQEVEVLKRFFDAESGDILSILYMKLHN
ncbi:hypothetical protein OAJ82_00270 [Alphaproteobacteria bacterium]|nr:hypothetical protein [Alphaproteobacteria bacterium]